MSKNEELTLEEAILLLSGKDFWHSYDFKEKGIPMITMSDGPYGLRKQDDEADHLGIHESIKAICFPTSTCLASTFDTDTAYKMGKLLGEECRSEGVNILLGPGVNIKRLPLGGRNFEYFSEDPCLSAKIATSFINGVQSCGVGCCVKHYALNNQENARMTVSANADERTLREIYLRSFEKVVKNSHPISIMSSYNRYNGEYVEANPYLLDHILRKEWGFDGIVISDWYATVDRAKSLNAGVDLEMPGGPLNGGNRIRKAILNKELAEDKVYLSANRIIETARKLNLERTKPYDKEMHHEEAIKIAADSAILLKNEGMLPLNNNKKYLFIGPFAKKPRYQGGGSSHINAYKVDNVIDNLKDIKFDYPTWAESVENYQEIIENTKDVSANYDGVVIFAGLPDEYESEGYDRNNLNLPLAYNEIITKLAENNIDITVVLMHGSVILMPWLDKVNAILTMQLAGEGVGSAISRILSGKVNPSGRLNESYPLCLEHTPGYLNSRSLKEVNYNEGVFVGYRYYETKKLPVVFPFGYGLSYTEFRYDNLRIQEKDSEYEIKVDITNIGDMAGKEVVQLYVYPPIKEVDRPICELKDFNKVYLEPQETKTVILKITREDLAYYDTKFIVDSGKYEISLNSSSHTKIISTFIDVKGDNKPLIISDSTTIGELLANSGTNEFVSGILKGYSMNAEGEAISSDMKQAMVLNAPLRLLKGIAKLDDEKYIGFKQKLQSLVK